MKRGVAALFFLFSIVFVSFSEQTVEEKRKDTLKFGLESEITGLIAELRSAGDVSLNEDLLALFSVTRNLPIKEALLDFFAEQKSPALREYALEVLRDPWDYKSSTVSAALSYVRTVKLSEAAPLIRDIMKSEKTDYLDRAISALGAVGTADDALFLVDYLSGEIAGDDKQRLIVRQNVMFALGELKAVETWDSLAAIVADTDENAFIRASAASALGKMGKPEAVDIVASLYGETDPVLREACIESVSNFSTPAAEALILEGFKDSYYKVRLQSIKAAKKLTLPAAAPYLSYRAKNDPVEAIRLEAMSALGSFHDEQADQWMVSTFKNEKSSASVRLRACQVLLESNPDLIYPEFERVILASVKDDKQKSFRYELGKLVTKYKLSKAANIAGSFLADKDTLTKSVGLDMFEQCLYPELVAQVQAIAADKKNGALQTRASKILEKNNLSVSGVKTDQ